jgi:hypothetical protein
LVVGCLTFTGDAIVIAIKTVWIGADHLKTRMLNITTI